MRHHRLVVAASCLVGLSLAIGCDGVPEPTPENLRDSFAEVIASIDFVEDFERSGDVVRFVREDGAGDHIRWEVEIRSTEIETQDDATYPYRGLVRSSWSLDGRGVASSPTEPTLPMWVLDAGISQECWAFWEEETKSWDW